MIMKLFKYCLYLIFLAISLLSIYAAITDLPTPEITKTIEITIKNDL